ncbi:MAG: ParB/RepB/Spo0J family partition protein [Bacteroidia bacterium]|nr:ParB/RepB/Spo0J family partition protein [Bacteroidia bacterium]
MSQQASEQEAENSLQWDIRARDLKITESKVVLIPVNKLNPHPDNRPLGRSEEKIRQLKTLIANDGFDSSHPLVVRPFGQSYQIIEGEHRFKAAKSLGYLQLPCVVRELTDLEALIQLVLGNIQSESKPLEIGLNALKVVQREGKGTYSVTEYARRLGVSETSIRRYMNASEVFQFIQSQLPEGAPVLDEVHKLEEIHRCPQSDWVWLHDMVIKQELSKNQVIEISQAIREIRTDNPAVYNLFDFTNIRQEIARDIVQGKTGTADTYKELIRIIETSHDNLDEKIEAYEYNVLNDNIQSEEINLKDWFVNNLKALAPLAKQQVLEAYKDALQLKRSSSKDEAERTAAYFRDKKNAKEREEQERLEREMRQIKEGEWWQLGEHYLFCGDGAQPEFYRNLPEFVSLAFCNPPYITEIARPDQVIAWKLDWLINKAEVVAVTPPLEQLQRFLRTTQMPYKWSMSAHLNVKKGDSGLGTWIYLALFSKKSIDAKARDAWTVDNSDIQGNKTYDLLKHLVTAFSREQEIVVDVYAGLGAMFKIAEETGRICYGAESNPALCKEIVEKWEDSSQQKAIRVDRVIH